MKFSIDGFFGNCDQICRKLKKLSMETFISVPCGASVKKKICRVLIKNFKITSNRYRNRTECNKCTKTDLFTVVITCLDTGVFLKFFSTILMEFVVALFSRLLIESIVK